jgi:hypothetical protein
MTNAPLAPAVAQALSPFRRAYEERPLPHVELPAAVSPGLAANLRAGLAGAPFERFDLAPRGRYERSAEPPDPALCASLVNVASFLAGQPFEVLRASWIRTAHRSYALLRDDSPPPGAIAELVLDVSERATGEGQLVYTHRGQPYFVATQTPGTLALVARGPTIQRYHRYVTHRAATATLLRLVIDLGPG